MSQRPIFIGCYTEKQRDSVWVNQIGTWGRFHKALINVDMQCYASMHKIRGRHYGLVILDEAQHLTPRSYEFFEHNTFDGVIILTATEPHSTEKRYLIRRLTAGRRLIIDADQAIDAKILNDFEIFVMQLTLDDTEKFKMLKGSNTLYTEKTGYLKHCGLVDAARRSGDQQRIRFASIARQRFIGSTRSKTLATAYVQEQFRIRGHRFLTFAASIAQADLLSPYTFHSETNDRYYNDFLHNRINELVSLKMIRESENFDNLGRGIHVQVDSNPGNTVQITGRLLRLPEGQMSRLYIMCAIGTMDESWVRKALSKTNPDKIFYHTLDKELYWTPSNPI